jgi:integrase
MSLKLVERNGTYHVHGSIVRKDGQSVRIRKSTGWALGERKMAQRAMARIMQEAVESTSSTFKPEVSVTGDDLVDAYLNARTGLGQTDIRLAHQFSLEFGKVEALKLTSHQILSWLESFGNKPNTVARKINTIKAMLKYCEERGLDVPKLNLVKPKFDDARVRWLTVSERDALINAMPEGVRDHVRFLFFTGCRLGEMFSLTSDKVQSDGLHFATRKGVSGRSRVRKVPVAREIELDIQRRSRSGRKYLYGTSTNTKINRNNFYREFKKGLKAAGIEDFTPHDCRHTFASLLIQKGVGEQVIATLLGHATTEMTRRYAHLAPTQLSSAVSELSSDTPKVVSDTNLTRVSDVVPPEWIEHSASPLPRERSTTELRRLSSSITTKKQRSKIDHV